jgi:hypothetical protein
MASVTTNYGFDVPTSSDLVKNGATQIALLGQDIDTFLFRPFTKNGVLNGAMDIWQRGTSVTPATNAGAYTADRWYVTRGSNTSATVSRQVTGDTTNLPFIQYCSRVQRTAASTTTTDVAFGQMMESVLSIPFAGQTVVLSGYIRKGTDFSAASNVLTMQLVTGTGTDQKQMDGGYTGQAISVTGNVTLTATWQRFSITGTIPSTATEITPKFLYTPTGTAGTNDYFEVTGVQLEVGSQATPFSVASSTGITGELAACQRYYQRFDAAATNEPLSANGGSLTTTISQVEVVFPVFMRSAPSSLDVSNFEILNYANNTAYNTGSLAINLSTKSAMQLRYTHGTAVFTAGSVVHFRSGSGTGYIGWSAEL